MFRIPSITNNQVEQMEELLLFTYSLDVILCGAQEWKVHSISMYRRWRMKKRRIMDFDNNCIFRPLSRHQAFKYSVFLIICSLRCDAQHWNQMANCLVILSGWIWVYQTWRRNQANGAKLWKSMPLDIRKEDFIGSFKSSVKNYMWAKNS